MSLRSAYQKVKKFVKSIGPRLQASGGYSGSYGGYTYGGASPTGPTISSSGETTSGGGGGVSVIDVYTGGGGGSRGGGTTTPTYISSGTGITPSGLVSMEDPSKLIKPIVESKKDIYSKAYSGYESTLGKYYQKQIENDISRYGNWNQLSSYGRNKIYNKLYKKYNKEYQEKLEGTKEKLLKEQYPDYDVLKTSTKEGVEFSLSKKKDIKKEISTDTEVQYAPDGSVLYSGEVSPIIGSGITKEKFETWKETLKEVPKSFEGFDLSFKPYVKKYKEEGIYKGTKYALTHPLIIKDIPVIKRIPEIIYGIGESTVKGLAKVSESQASPLMTAGGEEFKVTPTGKQKQRAKKFKEWVGYDPDIPLLSDPDVQMFGITAATVGLAGAGTIGAKVLQVGGRAFQTYVVTKAIKNPTEQNLAEALLFTAPELLANRGKIIQEVSGKRPSQYIPNTNEIAYVSKTSRQRSTLMIKDSHGNYLVSKKKGISAGGDIKVGETPRQSAIRELKEELGLSEKDFHNIKFKEKIVTPEETFHVFEATLKSDAKIKTKSDMIGGIKWVSPLQYKGVTGQTYRNPIMKNRVRVYELAIMNRLSGTKSPVTWLGYESKYGKVYFGTQSRYDVPRKVAKKYATLKEEMLIHATPDIPLSMEFGKPLKIVPSKIKRGGEGLYVQPPISTKPIPKEVLKLEGYTGKGKPIKPKKIKDLPVEVGAEPPAGYVGMSYLGLGAPSKYQIGFSPIFKRRGLFVTKAKVGKDIKLTKKALSGTESEQVIKFGREIKKKGFGEHIWVGGKKVRIREVDILQKEMKATEPLAEKGMKTEPTKKVKKKVREKQKRRTEIDEYVELVSPYKFLISKEKGMKEPSKIKEVSREIPREILRDALKEEPIRPPKEEPPIYPIEEPPIYPPSYPPSYIPSEPPIYPPSYPPSYIPSEPPIYPPSYPPVYPPKPPPFPSKKRKIVKKGKQAPSYDVFIKPPKKKKYVKVTKKPVGLTEARDTRNYFIDESVSRQGYLKPRQVKPSPLQYEIPKNYAKKTEAKFRTFKQRKGRKIKLPKERLIEKGKFLIDTKGEKKQLDIFKLMAQREKKKQIKLRKNKPVGLQFA